MKEIIKKQLEAKSEEKYRIFSSKLIPNIKNIIGVRLPVLRKKAKKISKVGYEKYLVIENFDYFEEIMLQGMIIGYINKPWCDKEDYIKKFIPKINNWSVCDSFCSGLKIKKEEKKIVWEFLRYYFYSDSPYAIRFAIVMVIFYFVDDFYANSFFKILDEIKHENYYVRMAIAWSISIFFRDFPKLTILYLNENKLDKWTFNKSLQKIRGLLKIDNETKNIIRLMKKK